MRAFYEVAFKAAFLEKKGTSFQDFFADIMGKRYPNDFQRVRPWGPHGDRKNDGYLKSTRTLFQVYAPNEMTEKTTIAKINEDFCEALPYWKEHFDTWVFVHNSYQGLGPAQTKRLLELDNDYKEIKIFQWGFQELRNELFCLSENDLAAILGRAPSQTDFLSTDAVRLASILESLPRCVPPPISEIRPVSEDKIEANELSHEAALMLKLGMELANKVDWYFQNHPDKQLGDLVAEGFRTRYEELRRDQLTSEEIFVKLYGLVRSSSDGTPQFEAHALAILAYFFEQCDIFEDSGSVGS